MNLKFSIASLLILASTISASCKVRDGSKASSAATGPAKTNLTTTAVSSSSTTKPSTSSAHDLRNSSVPLHHNDTSAPSNKIELRPIANWNPTNAHVPSKNITLNWGQDNTSLVAVELAMRHKTVVLEDLPFVSAVHCDSSSVRVSFSNADEFNLVQEHWSSLNDSFVIVTNHMGDCDTEFERGFFIADVHSLSFSAAKLTVQVSMEKTDIASIGDEILVRFSNKHAAPTKRSIGPVWKTGRAIHSHIKLPFALELFTIDDYVTVTAESAEIETSVVYSGLMRYSIFKHRLSEFTFDLETTIDQDLALTFDFTAPYTYDFEYDLIPLEYPFLHIPGILNLGPALKFGIGAEFTVEAGLSVTTAFSSQISEGKVHLDFLHPERSAVTNWEPTSSATANITELAAVTVAPFVSATVELEVKLLHGLFDLSTGATIKPSFPIVFDARANEDVNLVHGNWTMPTAHDAHADGKCPNALAVTLSFELGLELFATEWLSKEFGIYEKELAKYCYTWL